MEFRDGYGRFKKLRTLDRGHHRGSQTNNSPMGRLSRGDRAKVERLSRSVKVFRRSRSGPNMTDPRIQTLIQASQRHHAIGFQNWIIHLTGVRKTSFHWVSTGPTPDYESILKLDEIDGEPGPWLLLDGFIEQGQEGDDRLIFTFLRCLLAGPSELQQIFTEYDRRPYPGNMAIPDPISDTNTFAGEIPWSTRFAYTLRDGTGAAERQIVRAFESYGPDPREGVPVELPVANFVWERSLDIAQ